MLFLPIIYYAYVNFLSVCFENDYAEHTDGAEAEWKSSPGGTSVMGSAIMV